MIRRLFLWTCVALLLPALASAGPITSLHVIGDSLSDQGNAYTLTGGFPSSPYAQRATNGPVAVEHLASALGVPLAASTAGGTNYAVIGATTAVVANPNPPPATTDNTTGLLSGQPALFGHGLVQQTLDVLGSGPLDPSGLFFVWGGANDLLLNPSSAGASTAIANLTTAITNLYAGGARQFLVPNLPDLSQTPFVRSLPPANQAAAQLLTLGFNAALASALSGLMALPGIDITGFDTFALFAAISANPAAFGFSDILNPCFTGTLSTGGVVCANPNAFLYWDQVHPTAAGHALLGSALVASVGGPVPEPATLTLVGLGLGAAVARRRRAAARR